MVLVSAKKPRPAKPLPRKNAKALVATDVITDQMSYFFKINKLIEDEKRKHSLVVKTMTELLDAFSNSRERLQHIETWFWDLVESEHKRQLLVECAIDGFEKAGIFMLLADGRFTLDQLVKKAPNAKNSGGQGVYARIYLAKQRMSLAQKHNAAAALRSICQSIDERQRLRKSLYDHRTSIAAQCDLRKSLAGLRKSIAIQRKVMAQQRKSLAEQSISSLYIGSSRSIMSRMASHDHFLPKKYAGIHPTAHEEATRKYYRVLCDLSDNAYAQQDDRIRLVVEQLLIILLGTYICDLRTVDRVFAFLDKQSSVQGITEGIANKEHTNKDQLSIVDEPETMAEMFERLRDRSTTTSLTLAKLGSSVCAKCGWRPITQRSESNGQFGTRIRSLNQFSPIDTVEKRSKKAKKSERQATKKGL